MDIFWNYTFDQKLFVKRLKVQISCILGNPLPSDSSSSNESTEETGAEEISDGDSMHSIGKSTGYILKYCNTDFMLQLYASTSRFNKR